uniref:copine-8-like n=1 Tax=Styela clava TaxID=7725 RepID=UPI00193A57E2|nr:copine-8-like [Styela clava]
MASAAGVTSKMSNLELNNSKETSTYELSISCKGLKDADIFSKSDPMVVMYVEALSCEERWRELGRTEEIQNTLNPQFTRKFSIDHYFDEIQNLRFEVYDIDKKSHDLKDHDFLGWAECKLAAIIRAKRYETPLYLKKKETPLLQQKKKGKIIIVAEELCASKQWLSMKWEGRKLDRKDVFGSSDPFMVFSRCNEDGSFTVCHKTEVIKNNLNPEWEEFEISVGTLCGNNPDRKIKIEVLDWNRNGSHSLIGVFTTCLKELKAKHRKYELFSKKKKSSGTLELECKTVDKETFADYIKDGVELSCVVAIDFSFVHTDPDDKPKYGLAIKAVGEVIQEYDTDQVFSAYGFGANVKEPKEDFNTDTFSLNLNSQFPDCTKVEGIIEAFKSCLEKVEAKIKSKANFAPIIKKISEMASKKVGRLVEYFVLLIVTNGNISDMDDTKEAIVKAATLPMSIVIVGIGGGDFEGMEELDGDVVRLFYIDGKVKKEAKRDIVQFVPFRDFSDSNKYEVLSMQRLRKEVLQEIPDQFLEYVTLSTKKRSESQSSTKSIKKKK